MDKYDYKIAEAIALAQVASDGGKGIEEMRFISNKTNAVWSKGYTAKDRFIYKAINLINKSYNSMFHYYCISGPDQNGYGSVITYFEFKWEGIRYQISFHTPSENWKGIHIKKSPFITEWTHKFNSRDNAIFLLEEVMPML